MWNKILLVSKRKRDRQQITTMYKASTLETASTVHSNATQEKPCITKRILYRWSQLKLDKRIAGGGGTHLVSLWTHLASIGFIWTHLNSIGLTCIHMASLGFTWIHLVSLGFIWTCWIHSDSFGSTWIHLDSLEFIRTPLFSLELTWIHLVSLPREANRGQ